jgi:hypothetical protein
MLAIGDPATADERAHLDECDTCALDLAELEYTVAVGRSTVALGDIEAPPERVWDRISDELGLVGGRGDGVDAGAVAAADAGASEVAADDAPGMTASESASPAALHTGDDPSPRSGRRVRVLFALAASIAVILVVVGTWVLVRPAAPVEVAAATLVAFPDHPGAHGEAVVVETADGEKQVRVELDAAAGSGYREVWLITADASALVSLGVLESGQGVFPVPAGIDIRDYVLVDISEEPADGDPAHSGDSIVRGELGFA